MMDKKRGADWNISCIRSRIFRINMADYAAAKEGVVALTSAMALDLAPDNIRVNSIAPGFTSTGMTNASFDISQIRKQSEALIPVWRIVEPEDTAKVVQFFLSDVADYINGTTLVVDGGYSIEK